MKHHNFLQQLGCQYPIIQAPMAGVQDGRLAIAVCQAGGLGSLPCAMLSPNEIEQQVAFIRQQTSQPFNVNFFAHSQVTYTPQIAKKWFLALKPYYEKLGLTEVDIPLSRAGSRQPFSQQFADLIADLKVPVVSFHFGLPEEALLEQVRASGAKIISTATTIAEAKWLEQRGVDAIIAQGLEAGGHRGMFLSQDINTQMGTFGLIPNLKKIVDVPIIAAGGISDATTVRCALELGADAVQVGTAFLLADEANTKPYHRQILQTEQACDTALTNIFSGGIARGIRNKIVDEMGICTDAPPFPHASFLINPIKSTAEQQNDYEYSSLWAGQNASLAKAGSAKSIIERLCGI